MTRERIDRTVTISDGGRFYLLDLVVEGASVAMKKVDRKTLTAGAELLKATDDLMAMKIRRKKEVPNA